MIDPDGIGVNEGSEAPRAALVDAGAVSFRKGERYTVSTRFEAYEATLFQSHTPSPDKVEEPAPPSPEPSPNLPHP